MLDFVPEASLKFCLDVQLCGGVSQIEAELSLFGAANKNGPYQYYHLLSGMDLPLHNQDYIHAFFEKYDGYEFLTFVSEKIYSRNKPSERLSLYYPFQNTQTNRWIRSSLIKAQDRIFIPLQKLFKINRIKQFQGRIGYGSNWASVTENFVNYVLKQKDEVLKIYAASWCCDEIYKHTLLINSEFKDKLFWAEGLNDRPEDKQGNLRYINWWDGSPKTWSISDMGEIENAINRGYLFSRKFDERMDSEIIRWVLNHVANETYTSLFGEFVI